MAWRYDERLIVVMHGFKSPSRLEWQSFLNGAVQRGAGSHLRILVISHGGGPDGQQREQLARAMGSAPAPTVVMTSSALVRGITSALAFFNPHMKAVNLGEDEAAYHHLGLTADERSRVQQFRRELALEIGLEWKKGAR